jgi:hypothetical protein
MKKLLILFMCLLLSGCFSTITPAKQINDNQEVISKGEEKVKFTVAEIGKNDKGKKIQTSALAQGIQYSLNQVTNPSIQVDTAKSLNERVVSILGSPHIDEINRIKATVDLLNSAVEEERKKGLDLLAKRDELINKLQKEKVDLSEEYDDQLWQLTSKAKEVAKEADQNKAVVNSMSGMFGLNAVFWGLKKFFVSALTAIAVFAVVFVILRLLAAVNPIAGAAFSIFNMLGASVVSIIKMLTPKAFEMSNFAAKERVEEFKSPLVKIIDVIQELKEKQKESPNRVYPLTEILKRFDKEMDSHEKHLINDILREQKWIK